MKYQKMKLKEPVNQELVDRIIKSVKEEFGVELFTVSGRLDPDRYLIEENTDEGFLIGGYCLKGLARTLYLATKDKEGIDILEKVMVAQLTGKGDELLEPCEHDHEL